MDRRDFLRYVGTSALGLRAAQRRAVQESGLLPAAPRVLFGSMVSPEDIERDGAMRALAIRTCDALVVAGGVFWASLERVRGRHDFSRSDRLVAFGHAHSMVMRGSTLVWHEQIPSWLQEVKEPREACDLLRGNIVRVVGRFRGSVAYWDVLNEIVNLRDKRQDGLRISPWLDRCGSSYIETSLEAARTADSSCQLGYNEWGIEDDSDAATAKRSAVLAIIRRLRASKVPIDYLGIQGHLRGDQTYSDAKLGSFLRNVADLGVRVLVTELDVDDRLFPSDEAKRDTAVANTYARFLDVVVRNSAPVMITVWGLSDRSSYPQATRPRRDGLLQRSLPFDSMLRPKAAWKTLVELGIGREPRR